MKDEIDRRPPGDARLNLDAAAAEIEARRLRWTAAGFEVGDLTWRDAAAGWQDPFVTRSKATAPVSVGVQVVSDSVHVRIVLYAGHWQDRLGGYADVEGVDLGTDVYEISAPDVPNVEAFGELLDATFDRWSSE